MRNPSWRWLSLLTTPLIGLLGVVEAVVPAGACRRALEIVICVVTFATMHGWVRANRCALDMLGERDHRLRRAVDEPAPTDPPEYGRDTRIRVRDPPAGARARVARRPSPDQT